MRVAFAGRGQYRRSRLLTDRLHLKDTFGIVKSPDAAATHEKVRELFPDLDQPLLFGHRGCSSEAPENTVAAFDRAAELGVPGIELDVQQCASGELPVFHDRDLQRITGAEGRLTARSWSELKQLDAGAWFDDKFRGERIPRLEELFDRYGNRFLYDIEIKHDRRHGTGLERRLVKTIHRYDLEHRCIVSSFNPFALRAVRRLDRSIPLALIFSAHREIPWIFRRGSARFLTTTMLFKPHYEAVWKPGRFLKRALREGAVLAWTVNDREIARRLLESGVAGLISDTPHELAV